MSYHRWSGILGSTALLALMASASWADDVFVVDLQRPAVVGLQPADAVSAVERPQVLSTETSGTMVAGETHYITDAAKAAPAVEPAVTATTSATPLQPVGPQIKPQGVTLPQKVEVPVAAPMPEPLPIAAPTPKSVQAAPAAPSTADIVRPTVAVAPTPAPAPTPTQAPAVVPAAPAFAATAVAVPAAPALAAPSPVVSTVDLLSASLKTVIDAQLTAKPADDRRSASEDKKQRLALAEFYAGRAYAPLWVDAHGLTAPAKAALERLGKAADEGLDPADYLVPSIADGASLDALAKGELALAQAVLKYARHAQAGRFEPIRLSELVTAKPQVPAPSDVLKTLAAATNVSAALEAYTPPHEGYKRLRAKLVEMEKLKPPAPQAKVPPGPVIRPGEKDLRVAVLRERLGVNGKTTADDADLYDPDLVQAVKTFQKAKGLNPTGLVGPQTVVAVNETLGGPEAKTADIIANMERWRWLPRDLGSMYVMVNVPDFQLVIERNGVITHKARAIVGRVQNQTPIFSDTMTHIIVNPYWNVPESIVKKEFIGKAQETQGASLTRGNFEVEMGDRTVDPSTVDWATVNPGSVHIRQRPGDGNALGNIKFMFPNQHSVYIHDTSSRGLFTQSYRSLSHGCVRVNDPFSFADALMAEEPTGITGAKLKAAIGGGEKYFWLKRKIPVHIAYFNVFVDDAGELQSRPDLYGHNARTKQLLGL